MPDVEWTMAFEDFRVTGNVTWPHRLRKWMAGDLHEQTTIQEFVLNPDIDSNVFAVKR